MIIIIYTNNNNDNNNNNKMNCAFIAHSVLCKTMTVIRPINYF